MKANKVGQDFKPIGAKYTPCAIYYPRWMPVVFWTAVAAVFVVVGFVVEAMS